MRSSGTNTPSSRVSWLCVARMPSVSQVSMISKPGSSRSTNPWTITGLSGSEASRACTPKRVHTGLSEPKCLRP